MQWSTMVPWCSLDCTPACQAGGRGFKSRRDRHTRSPHKIANATGRGRVAQLAERPPEKRKVTGSTPVPTTIEASGQPHGWPDARSEEHTSELQSLMRISYAVFCLNKQIPH